MAREGYKLPFLEPLEHASESLVTMAMQLDQCLRCQGTVAELRGLVLVLAPVQLEKPKAFIEDLGRLAASGSLTDVRFIVVELGESAREPLALRFPDAAMVTTCLVDAQAQQRELSEAPRRRGECAGRRLARSTGRRRRAPRRERAAAVRASGARRRDSSRGRCGAQGGSRAVCCPGGPCGTPPTPARPRRSQRASEGQIADALHLQVEAREQCYAAGLTRLALILETTRASYLFAASQKKPAKAAFEQAAERAEGTGLFDLAAQAFLGAASLCAVERDWSAAALLANRAGLAAERSGETALAIEAYRCTGQFAIRGGSEKVAIDRWRRALDLAKEAPRR